MIGQDTTVRVDSPDQLLIHVTRGDKDDVWPALYHEDWMPVEEDPTGPVPWEPISWENRMVARLCARRYKQAEHNLRAYLNSIGLKDTEGTPQKQGINRRIMEKDFDRIFAMALESKEQHDGALAFLTEVVERFQIWHRFLKHVKGLGPVTAGFIVGYFDIVKARTPSCMTQYAGCNSDLVYGKKWGKTFANGSKEIIVTDTKIRGDKRTQGYLSPFNGELRTALLGVFADSLIKQGLRYRDAEPGEFESVTDAYRRLKPVKDADGKTVKIPQVVDTATHYVNIYLQYLARLERKEMLVAEVRKAGEKAQMIPWKDARPSHRRRAALRYMIKIFLVDLYREWRTEEGLEVRPPYAEEKLGHKHQR